MKRCPPGVLCIENVTMVMVIIISSVIFVLMYTDRKPDKDMGRDSRVVVVDEVRPRWPGQGVFQNPYVPPFKDERYFVGPPEVPINVSTAIGAVDTTYRQLGFLTPLNGRDKTNILPLMGRPLYTSRQKWQYYTISNQHNNVKLPISVKQRSALNDNGVDEVYNGDTVYVSGYDAPFKVTVYETDTIKYLPYL